MRAILQRVTQASVVVAGETIAQQGPGFLILLGITHSDSEEDVAWLARKIRAMRVFEDEAGKMNLSVKDLDGEVTVVSQFTLFAATKKGNRPSFLEAARPEVAEPLYEQFCRQMESLLGKPVATGRFGAMMEISLVNSGPVTITLDSKNPE